MRPLVLSTVCLLLLPLGCNSSNEDPEAAAKAAQSAAGGLKRLGKQSPVQNGPVIREPDHEVPNPGHPDDRKPPPSVGTATCIVDDGADSADDPDDTDIKTPGGFKPKGPIELPDRTTPEVEGVTPRSARGGGARSKTGAMPKSGPGGGEKPARALAKSADGERTEASAPTPKTAAINWSATCASRMNEDTCKDVCGALTWDESAGNGGTCFRRSEATEATGDRTRTSVKCGCMCLPGS